MKVFRPALALYALGAAAAIPAPAFADDARQSAKVDYADPAAWLCRPGRASDVCGRSDQDATIVRSDGTMTPDRFHADPDAPIDCFYVYPTVSLDPGGNSQLREEKEEVAVVNQQFARFSSVCRPYAPLYRQATLTALRSNLKGRPVPIDRALPYEDVRAASVPDGQPHRYHHRRCVRRWPPSPGLGSAYHRHESVTLPLPNVSLG